MPYGALRPPDTSAVAVLLVLVLVVRVQLTLTISRGRPTSGMSKLCMECNKTYLAVTEPVRLMASAIQYYV